MGINEDHIREDGTIDDTVIETFYHPCTEIVQADGYLRVTVDEEGCDIETRISNESIEKLGWVRKEDYDNMVVCRDHWKKSYGEIKSERQTQETEIKNPHPKG
jgi:hypothetical protein